MAWSEYRNGKWTQKKISEHAVIDNGTTITSPTLIIAWNGDGDAIGGCGGPSETLENGNVVQAGRTILVSFRDASEGEKFVRMFNAG